MTPLSRLLLRYLPGPVAAIALALVYTVLLGGILISGEVENEDILYIDVRGDD